MDKQKRVRKVNDKGVTPVGRPVLQLSEVGDLEKMKEVVTGLNTYLSDPTRRLTPQVKKFMASAVKQYRAAVERSLGVPGYSEDVTTQREAPTDIPTAPLTGFQLISRTCHVVVLASEGTTGGGFYATLKTTELNGFVGPYSYFRVRRVTSWTTPRQDGNLAQGTYAAVSVAGSAGVNGEVMPTWSENFTPVGQGFAGIVTEFPLGDFPLYTTDSTAKTICVHYTSLGGTGGIASVPVVFHVDIETLI